MQKNRYNDIKLQLEKVFYPEILEVLDESHNHHVPVGSQSHFKVTIVSSKFESLSLIERHRQVNTALKAEFNSGMHALAIHAYTPEVWQNKQKISPSSPKCLDGFKNTLK